MMTDIAILLKPISTERPTGIDLRLADSSTDRYYTLKDLRNTARGIERKILQGENDVSAEKYWQKMYTLCLDTLTTQSKDLEIAVWLSEASLRLQGLNGLAQSFHVIAQLIEKYFTQLYPTPDEDGMITKLAPLIGINGEEREGALISPIRDQAITQDNAAEPYKLWQYQQCIEIDKILDDNTKKNRYTTQHLPTLAELIKAAADTPIEFYTTLDNTIDTTVEAYRNINFALSRVCDPAELPPTTHIHTALQSFKDHIGYLLSATNRTQIPPEKNPLVTVSQDTHQHAPFEPTQPENGLISDRENAISTLKHISLYFKQSEPHSPISALCDRAVKWSRLSFQDLANEMITDNSTRSDLEKLTGITFKHSKAE